MFIRYFLTFFLFLLNFDAMNLSFADNSNNFNIIYIGGGSMSSSPATTGTTSVPSTRYSTPAIQAPHGGTIYVPRVYLGGDPLSHYLQKRMEKKQTKKQIRQRNNDILRLFGIP